MDTLSRHERSERMSLVRSRDTGPEKRVRSVVHSLGYRYRLHDRRLPGCPDLVFRSRRKVIFVHGCFWHRHPRCKNTRLPKSRLAFWKPKLFQNRIRDLRNERKLLNSGWRSFVIWECETYDCAAISRSVKKFLGKP